MSLALKKSVPATKTNKKKLSVFVAGIGAVGGTLLKQITSLKHSSFDLQIIGICNSRFVSWYPSNEELTVLSEIRKNTKTNWKEITKKLITKSDDDVIFVDATGSKTVAEIYSELLQHGIHIATPSKRANSLSQKYYDELFQSSKKGRSHYRFETAVGAGLPIISTLKTLLNSGDEITKISGVASGTMTFLFTQLQNGTSFSEAVKKAKEGGYSEPDPRDCRC